ncbi:MAG: CDP-alcohol phosphatidyltransferase family protein [Firmicutes bacterium]|nr:CDP-alcohol phosphatidyltransferase family protein [Bacillota bacterium]
MKIQDALTLSRVVFIPLVMVCWGAGGQQWHWLGLALFSALALTDYADGRIARHRHETSRFGAYTDPLADKLLVLGCASVLVGDHRLSVWWFFLVLTRELSISTLRALLRPGVTLPASVPAKFKTLSQLVAVGSSSVFSGWGPDVLLGLSLLLTLGTGVDYFRRTWSAIDF